MRRVRVLYVENSSGVGGSVISLYRLVRALDREQYEPLVLFHRPNGYAERFEALGVETITLSTQPRTPAVISEPETRGRRNIAAALGRYSPTAAGVYWELRAWAHLLKNELPAARRISQVIRERRVDLVHLNNQPNSNQGGLIAARWCGVPVVCHVRDYNTPTWLDRWLTHLIHYFAFISIEMERQVQQFVPGRPGEVVYDGLDLTLSTSAIGRKSIRAEFGFGPEEVVVGNIGRLTPWKGQEFFLRAMARARQHEPRLRALIVGEPDPPSDTGFQDRLLALTGELGLDEAVTFTGFRSDLGELLSGLDILVHSSTKPEPFGLVILEGMACGKPVIATRAGGVLDFVADGQTGVLIPIGDEPAMAQALLDLVRDREGARRMGEQARAHVVTHFTVEQFARSVEGIYRRLLPVTLFGQTATQTVISPETVP